MRDAKRAAVQAYLDQVSPLGNSLAPDEAAHLRLLLAQAGAVPPALDSAALQVTAQHWMSISAAMRWDPASVFR